MKLKFVPQIHMNLTDPPVLCILCPIIVRRHGKDNFETVIRRHELDFTYE
jgi:hypothetical protein